MAQWGWPNSWMFARVPENFYFWLGADAQAVGMLDWPFPIMYDNYMYGDIE